MEKMKLHVCDFDSYNDMFPLWSVIYTEIGDEYFPDDQWWDCTSSVLDMWMENVHRMVCRSTDCCTLYFMDGDYSIRLTRQGKREALAVCLGPREKTVLSETIDLMHFARQLLAAVGKMRMQYADHLNSRAIQRLTQMADKLRIAMTRAE